MMNVIDWVDSLILGIVQGLTEFFPVSSDGHLVTLQSFLGYHKENISFDLLLHFGTLMALFVLFRKEFFELLVESSRLGVFLLKRPQWSSIQNLYGKERFTFYVLVTTFVTGIIGISLKPWIEQTFASVFIAAIGFLVTSAYLLAARFAEKKERKPESLSLWFPLVLGVAQASALLPGISRSGSTIATGILFGLKPEESARFSFVIAMPIIALAVLSEVPRLAEISSAEWPPMLFGVLVSFLTGLVAIKGLLAMMRRTILLPFAIYTAVLGISLLIFLARA